MSKPGKLEITLVGMMGVTGLGFTLVLPILVGAVVDGLQLDRSMIGWITASNVFGLTIGALVATLLIGRVRLTRIIQAGCLGLILMDGLSFFADNPSHLLGLRFLAGLAGGSIYASALAAFSGLKNSIRAFSVYIICYTVSGGILLITLPYLIAWSDYRIGFLILVGLAFASLLFTRVVASFEGLVGTRNFETLPVLLGKKGAKMTLLSYFLLQMGGGVMYTYSERIGKEAGLSSEYIGLILSFGSFISLFGAILVIRIGTSSGTRKPVLFGMILMSFFIALLFWSEYAWLFASAMLFNGLWWAFLLPFYQQLQARYDPLGRIVSFGTIVNMGGRSFGPALAAVLLGTLAYENVLWLSLFAILLALISLWPYTD